MRNYIGGGMKQTKALATEFQMHYLGNPSFERSVPKPVASGAPVEVEHGAQTWRMPSGAAAVRAAVAIESGEDVEAKLAALGGVRLA